MERKKSRLFYYLIATWVSIECGSPWKSYDNNEPREETVNMNRCKSCEILLDKEPRYNESTLLSTYEIPENPETSTRPSE